MNDGLARKLFSTAALLAAGFVCLQVGVVQVRRNQESHALESRLGELERESSAHARRLEAQLERSERVARRLRLELAEAEAASEELQNALRDADSKRDRLRNELGKVAETIEGERPAVDVQIAQLDGAALLVASVTNRGKDAVAVEEARGGYWVDGGLLPLSGDLGSVAIEPGADADVFEWDAAAHALELVPGAREPLRGALCFVFSRQRGDRPMRWAEERWFEHHPSRGRSAVLRHESWPLVEGAQGCDLHAIAPPW